MYRLILLISLLSEFALAQQTNDEAKPVQVKDTEAVAPEDEILTVVEQMPQFPGGQVALMKYLGSNINYPQECRKMGVEGKVFIKFIVNKEGYIYQSAVLRGVPDCKLLEKEALRVVDSMPKWSPGKQRGQAVNVYFTLPISFQLNQNPADK